MARDQVLMRIAMPTTVALALLVCPQMLVSADAIARTCASVRVAPAVSLGATIIVTVALLMAIMFVLRLTLKQSETASGPIAGPIRAASCSRHQQRL